jgi:hypothetical protein
MSIDAIALVRIPGWTPDPQLFAIALEDAFLVPTTAPFASEPDELGLALRHRLGDVLDRHDDPRGVFMIPDVASPRGKTYAAVVDEIGEAGTWAPIVAGEHLPDRYANAAPGSFEALAGQLMSAIGGGTIAELQRAMMTGDAEAFGRAQQQMMEAIAKVGDPEEIARSLAAALPVAQGPGAPLADTNLPMDLGAVDLDSPDFQALLAQAEADLAGDPERRAALDELLRGAGDEGDEVEESDSTPRDGEDEKR